MLSIRPDVLPPEALYEMQKLCDSVPAFPTATAIETIERELGCPVAECFDLTPEAQPIAAASLGQVYKCTLKENGATIALKVSHTALMLA